MSAGLNFTSRRNRVSSFRDLLSLLLILFLLATATSCLIVPVPATRKNIGQNNLEGSTDTEFIRAGETTRKEIVEKLGWLNIGPEDPKIFWGRWRTSGTIVAGAAGFAAGADRMWSGRNIVVEFDENGKVREWRVFDDSELPKEIAAWTKRSGEKLDLTQPARLAVRHHHAWEKGDQFVAAQLSLSANEMEFSEGAGAHNFTLAPSELKILKLAGYFAQIPRAETINITLDFHKKTRAGNHLALELRWADLVTLLRYVEQVRPQALPPPPKQNKNKKQTNAAKRIERSARNRAAAN